MDKENQMKDDFITVIPYCTDHRVLKEKRIVIKRLFFWYDNVFDHPINDTTVDKFLLNVKMFGATVFPDFPELGCLATAGDKQFDPGETPVSQILYKGAVIYCRS